ncbi:MAG: hypothetical protein AB7I30_10530 [Isosphaeraceae bacterium]
MNPLIIVDNEDDVLALGAALPDVQAHRAADVLALDPADVESFVDFRDTIALVGSDASSEARDRVQCALNHLGDAPNEVLLRAYPGRRLTFPVEWDTPELSLIWLRSNLPEWTSPVTREPSPSGPVAGETQAEALLRLASVVDLTRTPDGKAFARVPIGDHNEIHEIRSVGFKRWLTRAFYHQCGKPPTSDAMQATIGVLEARAQFDGRPGEVFVRIAPDGQGGVFVDLGDDSWRAVHVRPDGWRIVANPPVQFRRPNGLRALPTPDPGGPIHDLLTFANVVPRDFVLAVAWITAALLPAGPYPVLAISGEQGSAKSSLARLLRSLIDPHASLLRSEPKEARDLMVSATNSWIVALDNLSHVPSWMSDCLCRLATGGGFATRQLYTDSEETFLDAQRPVILTGIEDLARRGDLADRCLFLHLPTIPEVGRQTESVFWERFNHQRGRIFGAILTTMAAALRLRPTIHLERLPRMADFAIWGEAVARAMAEPPGTFMDVYQANRRRAIEAILEDSPVATALQDFMRGRGAWEGKTQGLLDELNRATSDRVPRDRWPKSARGLSGALRRVAPALRALGWHLTFEVDRERRLRIEAVNPGEEPTQRAQPAQEDPPRDGRALRYGVPPALTGSPIPGREVFEL